MTGLIIAESRCRSAYQVAHDSSPAPLSPDRVVFRTRAVEAFDVGPPLAFRSTLNR